MLFSVAAFLAVLSILARQLPATEHRPVPVVLRKIYRTTTVETIVGSAARGGTSVSQSVSSSGASGTVSAPTSRTS